MGIALHLIWPSFDAEMLRTGGLRALGLTLAPSANVFKLPDMTAWSGVFKVPEGSEKIPSYRVNNSKSSGDSDLSLADI